MRRARGRQGARLNEVKRASGLDLGPIALQAGATSLKVSDHWRPCRPLPVERLRHTPDDGVHCVILQAPSAEAELTVQRALIPLDLLSSPVP